MLIPTLSLHPQHLISIHFLLNPKHLLINTQAVSLRHPPGKTFINSMWFSTWQRDERNCLCNISSGTPAVEGRRLSAMAARATRNNFPFLPLPRSKLIATCRSLFSDIYAQLTEICIFHRTVVCFHPPTTCFQRHKK